MFHFSLDQSRGFFNELTTNWYPAGGSGEEVSGAEGEVGGEVLEEQRLRHRDALQAV